MTNTLSTSLSTGITLTPTGAYQSPFIITSTGTINPVGYRAVGIYASAATGGLVVLNYGLITGGPDGALGIYLNGGTIINLGTISGGNGSKDPRIPVAGVGIDLAGTGAVTNLGIITGGTGVTNGSGGVGVVLNGAETITNFGTITGGTGDRGGAGIFLIDAYTVINSGTISGGTGGTDLGGAGVYLDGGTLINSGIIDGATNGSAILADAVQFGPTVGTLVIEAGAAFTGSVIANAAVADVLAIGGTSPVILSGLGTQFTGFRTLAFDPGAVGSVSGTYTALRSQSLSITGFTQGDTLILDGFAATTDHFLPGTGLALGNGTSTIILDITGSFSTSNFSVIDPPANTTISLNAPCFAAGTRILTTRGEIAVENLTLNDHVVLHTGTTAPIQWLGFRSLSLHRHPNPEQVSPIHIQAGALADNIPHRDLVLSPDHALYLNGTLIPAKALLNGTTIRQDSPPRITYFHIELANHAILYAEGTPSESYLETGNRHAFTNSHSLPLLLHPNLAQTKRVRKSCAPFTESGPLVEAVRAQILTRANIPLTTDPALSLHTNKDGSVTILSRSAIPGQLNPDPRDQRRLGVKIASLTTESGAKIPLDHPLLTEGWHDPEPDGRWTNGRSVIPAELVRGEKIILAPAATLAYPVAPAPHRRRA